MVQAPTRLKRGPVGSSLLRQGLDDEIAPLVDTVLAKMAAKDSYLYDSCCYCYRMLSFTDAVICILLSL